MWAKCDTEKDTDIDYVITLLLDTKDILEFEGSFFFHAKFCFTDADVHDNFGFTNVSLSDFSITTLSAKEVCSTYQADTSLVWCLMKVMAVQCHGPLQALLNGHVCHGFTTDFNLDFHPGAQYVGGPVGECVHAPSRL